MIERSTHKMLFGRQIQNHVGMKKIWFALTIGHVIFEKMHSESVPHASIVSNVKFGKHCYSLLP